MMTDLDLMKVREALKIAQSFMPTLDEVKLIAQHDDPAKLREEIAQVNQQVDVLTQGLPLGSYVAEARKVSVDKQDMVAVWTDGVSLTADNGRCPLSGHRDAHCVFKLEAGKRYRITTELLD